MSQQYPFHPFALAINKRLNEMAKHELYKVDLGEVDIKDVYLGAFPEGTNPIYKTNTEHDCTCCKNFLRNVGNVIAVVNGQIMTPWDVKGLAYPYDVVAAALHEAISSAANNGKISGVWRTKEVKYGAQTSKYMRQDGKVGSWDHFWFDVPKKFVNSSPGEACGAINSTIQVASRGLAEITLAAVDTVVELITSDTVYRGAEHLASVQAFRKLKVAYEASDAKGLFSYAHYQEPASRIRNSVIGTLLVDLSEGVDLEKAVKSFEAKVAPANYKRPKALITQGMINQALKTISEEGLTDSLKRRHATLADVHINDVLWVSSGKEAIMKGGVEALGDLLSKQVKQTTSQSAAELGIDEFMKLLSGFKTIEAFMSNPLTPNLVCITAPEHADAPALFKWETSFGWSYKGGVTDSIKERVKAAGGKIDAEFRISLSWHNTDDLDLHVQEPNGEYVHFADKRGKYGHLDVDMNAFGSFSTEPVENYAGKAAHGVYACKVNNFNLRNTDNVGCTIEVEYRGTAQQFSLSRGIPHKKDELFQVKVDATGAYVSFSRTDWYGGQISQKAWGLSTETWVPVTTIMLSPNFWQGKEVGNKHTFFMLEGCKNDEPVRGIYNEFLRPDLDKHRKVFEVLAAQTKVEVADNQLAGLGFSSTQRNSVTLRCTDAAGKQRQYKVNF